MQVTPRTRALAQTMTQLLHPRKGILAADESNGTCSKRFQKRGIESTPETRRQYRETLITTPGLEDTVSGIILYDETLRQNDSQGTPFTEILHRKGVLPGIKVDTGAKPMEGAPGETLTSGLDGLEERLEEYYDLGARFTKWRAVIRIDANLPSDKSIQANAVNLAQYAKAAQNAGLVPMVEPEVLMDGSHSLERCMEATEKALNAVFTELGNFGVNLRHIILKPNMVLAGKAAPNQSSVDEVAQATLRTFKRAVPKEVRGIAFLSGGQSPQRATDHLRAMNQEQHPWELTFSFGRAIQQPALDKWAGKAKNVEAAQAALKDRLEANSLARQGF